MHADRGGEPSRWDLVAETASHDFAVFRVARQRRRHRRSGREADFSVVHPADWVVVAAVTPAREILLVRQFRFGAEQLTWEMPAGCREPGEDPVAAAVRELREETGHQGGEPRLLGWNFPNPAIQSNRCWYVLVPDVRRVGETAFDEHEELELRAVPVTEAYRWVRDGRVSHALAIAGFHYLQAVYPEAGRGGDPH